MITPKGARRTSSNTGNYTTLCLQWCGKLCITGTGIEVPEIPRENFEANMINRVGDEESGEHVYGVMEMTEQNDDTEKDRRKKTEKADLPVVPKDQGHQEGQTGVAGKEEIGSGIEDEKVDVIEEGEGIEAYVVRKRSDMGQGQKSRADDHENGRAFQPERQFPGIAQTIQAYDGPENNRSVDENIVDIDDRYIRKDDIGHGAAGSLGGVIAGQHVYRQTGHEKSDRDQKRSDESRFGESETIFLSDSRHILWESS